MIRMSVGSIRVREIPRQHPDWDADQVGQQRRGPGDPITERPPQSTRLSTSRPRKSVPSGYWWLGGLIGGSDKIRRPVGGDQRSE